METSRPFRVPTNYLASIYTSEGVKGGFLTDVTPAGARLENVGGVKVGEVVGFMLLSHQVSALVIWIDGGSAGVEFQPQLTREQFKLLCHLEMTVE